MKNDIFYLIFGFVFGLQQIKAQENQLNDLVFIEGGTFVMNKNFNTMIDDEVDTTYLYHSDIALKTPAHYFLSNHEVTNAEYWEFIKWVQDSVARKHLFEGSAPDRKALWGHYVDYKTYNVDASGKYFVLNWDTPVDYYSYLNNPILKPIFNQTYGNYTAYNENIIAEDKLSYCYEFLSSEHELGAYTIVDVFPNTAHWSQAFPYSFKDFSDSYFKSKVYDNYPVVGVSYIQAKAYCHWITRQFKKNYHELSRKQRRYFTEDRYFRLPTEEEWEYAAIIPKIEDGFLPYEDIRGYRQIGEKYQANFGEIVLNSNIRLKGWMDDGAMITSKIGSYQPNAKGIYDIFGNVAEWTSDEISLDNCEIDILQYDQLKEVFNSSSQQKDSFQLYITNPITLKTHLVVQDSEEHKKLLTLRREYYAFSPADSKEEMLRKYVAFNAIDATYYDSVAVLMKYKWRIIDVNLDTSNGLVDGVVPTKMYNRNTCYYNNYTGSLRHFDHFDTMRVLFLINNLKHDYAVINRATNYQSREYITKNRIVKGGSWADQAHYLISGSREVYNEAESSCKVGFRVAMDAPEKIDFLNFKDKKRLRKLRKLRDLVANRT